MINMSKFAETLGDLMFDKNLTVKTFAQSSGINETCITHYLQTKYAPSVGTLIKIADYFNRSTDFLLGLEEENLALTFKSCPPFSEQLVNLKKHFGYKTSAAFYTDAKISKSRYYDWLSGMREPTVDNVIKIAEHFDCRVDFILGREN